MSLPDKRTAFGASEIALIGLIVLGATLRLWDIGGKAIWLDEAYSIWIANHSLWQGVRLVAQVDFNPPLYYVFLSLWQSVFGDGQVAVRILSALFSTAAIPFLFSFTRRICDDKLVALVAVLLLVFSSFQVHYAQETRMYSLLVLVAAMAMFFAVGCLDDLHERRLAWRDWLRPRSWRQPGTGMAVGLSVSQTAIMLTHNTATVFFPLALNGTVFGIWLYQRISNRPTSMRAISSPWFLGNWIRIQAVTLLLWLPWAIPFALQGMRADQDFWLDAPSISTFITTINNFNFAHIPQWIHTRAVFLLYAGLVLLGILNWRRRLAWVMLMLAFMSVPFVGEALVSLRRPIFIDRTLIWTTLAYHVLVASGIIGLARASLSKTPARQMSNGGRGSNSAVDLACGTMAVAALSLLIGYSVISLHNYYANYEKEEWDVAAKYLAGRVNSREMVLFHSSWTQIPFEYYARDYDEFDVELRGLPHDLIDSGLLEEKMSPDFFPRLDELVRDKLRVWLVYSHANHTDREALIPDWFSTGWDETSRKELRGVEIYEYKKKQPHGPPDN